MDPKHFRQVLGQYPTGVVIVTSVSAQGEALGMTVGSFTSVSLDPPLVAFLPDKASSSWRALRESGPRFCVNVLAAQQEDVCRAVASRKVNKFHDIRWRPSAAGNPVIDGAVAYMDCTLEAIHDAGDHHIVVGRVHDLDLTGAGHPLLFFRGGYGSFRPQSLAAGDADLVEQLKLVDRVRTTMEGLADRFGTEVTVVCLVNDQLVLTAAAGHTGSPDLPTRVGLRLPFMPPVGSVNAAWGSAELRERWLASFPVGPRFVGADRIERPNVPSAAYWPMVNLARRLCFLPLEERGHPLVLVCAVEQQRLRRRVEAGGVLAVGAQRQLCELEGTPGPLRDGDGQGRATRRQVVRDLVH